MQTIQKAHPILVTLLKIQRKYGKDYSWPSQKKMLELLEKCQGLKKSRATLNRWLAQAQGEKYFLRRRRIKRHPVHGLVFKSSLYKITIKGYRLLALLGVPVENEIKKFQLWLEEIRPRHERRENLPGGSEKKKKEVQQILKTVVDSLSP
ncbi:MAG TPA: hypothetical protein VMW42_10750 [Desulfatiglandales bacterium]|nr:hypothetical protein [Desulfatiglandales bacterium]